MRKDNKILNISQSLSCDDDIETSLLTVLTELEPINSFIVYRVMKDNELTGWNITYNVSQNNDYNTLSKDDVLNCIMKNIKRPDAASKRVVCYLQPPVELLIKLYKPLIIKLAKEQHQHWNKLEMEDLIQMCNLVICDLYYKGYYIHKALIRRAYINYVLMHIRKERNKPIVISLNQEYSKTDDDDRVTIADMIADDEQLNKMEDKYDKEVEVKILTELKEIVMDYIGPRQYDQLLREYSNKSTTNWSRKLMMSIKAHLFEMGINNKSFTKYYN